MKEERDKIFILEIYSLSFSNVDIFLAKSWFIKKSEIGSDAILFFNIIIINT